MVVLNKLPEMCLEVEEKKVVHVRKPSAEIQSLKMLLMKSIFFSSDRKEIKRRKRKT